MLATCHACGHEPPAGDVRLLQDTRGGRDIDAIRRRAREAAPGLRELLYLIADRLEAEDVAVAGVESTLRDTYRNVVEVLREAAERPTDLRTRAILGATADDLADMLEAAGIKEGRARLADDLQALIRAARESADVQGLPAGVVQMDAPAVRALLDPRDGGFWRDKISKPSAILIRDGMNRALQLQPLARTVDDIATRLDKSIGQATSIARTEIAIFDSTVNTQVAQDAGTEQWWYQGPLDNLTRPFCRAVMNKVVDVEQMQQLDNGQGVGNPLITRGGFNCRHRWVGVSDGFVARRGLQRASAEDIAAANAGGAR